MNLDRLTSVAAQLVARVHDDDPDANAAWLEVVTDAEERRALPYVLAAMVPTDKTVGELLAWTRRPAPRGGRVIAIDERAGEDTLARARRREYERQYKRRRRAQAREEAQSA